MSIYDLIDLKMTKIKKKTKAKKKLKLTAAEKKANSIKRFFSKKIVTTFKWMWFEYLNTEGIHRHFNLQKGELDQVFIYENILLVCEDTTHSPSNIKSHLLKKNSLFNQIDSDKEGFLNWIKKEFSEKVEKFDEYGNAEYKIFFLYFSRYNTLLSKKEKQLYDKTIVIEYEILSYFEKISKSIKLSSKTELFRFLWLISSDIWTPSSAKSTWDIESTIIAPDKSTWLKSWARMVSFMMSAETLIKNSYVLRKDNWEDSFALYQRFCEESRIKAIRAFVAEWEESFINNIIVSLPDTVTFVDKDWNVVDIDQVTGFDKYTIRIPDEMNTICIIDWQHRVFAHYEWNDKYEPKIKKLRWKLHLLVTWLVFPKTIGHRDRIKYESEIFLNINQKSKPVPADVILHIEAWRNPYGGIGISREVLVSLNESSVFKDKFQLSLMKADIKVASIIKFVLKWMVEINESKETFYKYWDEPDKEKILNWNSVEREEYLEKYISFIVNWLDTYFSAVKNVFKQNWEEPTSKILSVVSVNGFLISLRKSFDQYWKKDFAFYKAEMSKLTIDFSKEKFEFSWSQYNKLSVKMMEVIFSKAL